MKITKEITLDVSKLNRFQSIIAKQNDKNSRYLRVSIADEGNVLVIPSYSKVTITATRPDKLSSSFLGEVCEDGKAIVPLTPWMLELDGSLSCEVSIITEESVLKTTSFKVEVDPDESSEESDITQEPNYDILVELIQEVNGIVKIVEQTIPKAVDEYLNQGEENAGKTLVVGSDGNVILSDKTSQLDKKITNLEQGITPSPFETDNTVAYSKIVPENALPYAEISKIGGMTRKCTNLIPTQSGYTKYGVTVNVSADGTVSFSGKSTDGFVHNFLDSVMPAGDYYISWNDADMTDSAYLFVYDATNARYLLSGTDGKFNVDGTQRIRIFVNLKSIGTTVNGTVRPMLNEGTTALPYEPYFEGLRSAPVTEVESVGKNLIASQEMDKYIPFKVPKGNVITASVANPLTDYLKIGLYDNNFDLITNNLMGLTDADTDRRYSYISLETDVSYARWNAYSNNEKTVIAGQVEYGSRPTVYKPYRKSTLPIPESVQALEGYGWGVNESAYNYVDFEKKQFVQNVGKVELDGTEQWLLHTATNVNQFYVTSFVAVKSSSGGSIRTLCSHYKDISVDDRGDNFGTCYSVSNGGIAFNINDIEGVTAWKAHLAEQYSNGTPVTVYVELAESIVTDISDILSDDNYIEVESGGTVTMVNEFNYAVPSEITYQIKGTPIDESAIEEAFIKLKKEIEADYATKEYVEQEIATFDFIKIVTALPKTGLINRFYLVPKKDAETQDFFDEYIWVNKGTEEVPEWGWEWLATKQIEVDLTNYASRDFVAFQIENLIGEEETDDEEDRTIEGTRRYAESLIDYKMHEQDYLSLETTPYDLPSGVHSCEVNNVEALSPDGSWGGLLITKKYTGGSYTISEEFISYDSKVKYERKAFSSQEWADWKRIPTYDDVNNATEYAKTLLELWYGVGSIYLNVSDVNPADILGFGEWQLLKNMFLLGAGDKYIAGSTGGEETHTLTASELPKQNGTIVTHGTYSGTPIADVSGVFKKDHVVEGKYLSGSQGTSASSIDVIGYSNGGEGVAHNNMPPYIAVYMWMRIG